jgi:hypothetical protein
MPLGIEPKELNPISKTANPAPEPERVLQPQDASTNLNDSESAPNSQDTHVSSSSKANGHSQLASDSSSLSNFSYDTSSTSPISLKASLAQNVASLQPPTSQIERPVTPEVRNVLKDSASEGTSSVSTSPMSVGSHALKQGSKRTASGAVKAPVVESTGVVDYARHTAEKFDVGRVRSSSRAAEVGTLFMFLLSSLEKVKSASNVRRVQHTSSAPRIHSCNALYFQG